MTLIIKVIKFILNVIYLFFKCFKTRNQITLISRESNQITPDFKLLKEDLEKRLPDYKIVVLCKKMDNKLLYCFHMLKQMYNISRSKIIILDTYCITASMLKHKKNLEIIQIWHAIGMMKKAGYAIIGKKEGRNAKVSKEANMHKGYTHVFTSSESCIDGMSKVFNCNKKIIESVPLPRIDLLKNEKYINQMKKEIYKNYPTLKNKVNILYAPTFRKEKEEFNLKVEELINNFDFNNFNLILKLHPLEKMHINNKNIIVPDNFNTNEMMCVCEYVISDYSSIIYEAGIMNKKMIFYSFDLDDYKDNRDFFIDYTKELPGPIFKNGIEISEFLKNPTYSKYNNKLIEKYVDLSIDNYTENMSKRIIELLK